MIQKILEKVFSGRWFATVSIIMTYCFIVMYSTIKYCEAISRNADKMESFATGLIVGFSGTAVMVLKAYFDDRKQEASK